MEFIQLRIAEDFGFSENETMNSLRETLTKLKVGVLFYFVTNKL